LNPLEQTQVDLYRDMRRRFNEGPYYSVVEAASLTAKKGSAARANFDAFHGMPTYSSRYLKKSRTLPKMSERPYGELDRRFFMMATMDRRLTGGTQS
jgi:DNA-directed RNA polymerase III subunit RPC7